MFLEQYVQLQHLIRTFNWHTPSWDLFIMLFWLVASVLYAFAAGRGRSLSILVSVYMAKLLVLEAPFLSKLISEHLNPSMLYLQQLITFAAVFMFLFFFLSKYAFKSSVDGKSAGSLIFGVLFAFTQVGLLINIILGFLPEATKNNLAGLIKFLFIQGQANFIWLVLPVIFLVIFGRFVAHRSEL